MHLPTQNNSIHLKINLVNVSSPIQLSIINKQHKRIQHNNSNSQQVNKYKQKNNYSLQDATSNGMWGQLMTNMGGQLLMDDFHPTMSTESLCKVKRMYQKTIKSKKLSSNVLLKNVSQFEQFSERNVKDNNVSKHKSSTTSIKGPISSQQSRCQPQIKDKFSKINYQNDKHINKKQSNNTQNQKLSNKNCNLNNIKYPSRKEQHNTNPNANNKSATSKQCELECYDTFQQDEDFETFQLKSDFGKKNKTGQMVTLNLKKSITANQRFINVQKCGNKGDQSRLRNEMQQMTINRKKNQKSKSKSRSVSRSKSMTKNNHKQLKQLKFLKVTKSTILNNNSLLRSKQGKKSEQKQRSQQKSHSQSINNNKKKKNLYIQTSKSRSKSKSHNKNKSKEFINSKNNRKQNLSINLNPMAFSPSPKTTIRSISKSKGSISKQKSKPKSKDMGNSKFKNGHSKSVEKKRNNKTKRSIKLNVETAEFKVQKKQKNIKQYKSPSSKQKDKKSTSHKKSGFKEDDNEYRQKGSLKNRIKSKRTKQSKQLEQNITKAPSSNKLKKNKSKRATYAKVQEKATTSFDRPKEEADLQQENRKARKRVKQTQIKPSDSYKKLIIPNKINQAQKSSIRRSNEISQDEYLNYNQNKILRQSQKSIRSSVERQFSQSKGNICSFYLNQETVNAIRTIQSYFRGYKVRKQLGQDLNEICSKVQHVKLKIQDKSSKYWGKIQMQNKKSNNTKEQMQKYKQSFPNQHQLLKNKFSQMVKNELFQRQNNNSTSMSSSSLLSSLNSVQNVDQSRPASQNNITEGPNYSAMIVHQEKQGKKGVQLANNLQRQIQQSKQQIRRIPLQHSKQHSQQNFPAIGKPYNFERQNKQIISQNSKLGDQIQQQQFEALKNNLKIQHSQPQYSQGNPRNLILNTNIIQPPQKATFQFYQAYSPKHYIISPSNNIFDPSPHISRVASPISCSSSAYNNHMQIPFSLRSPKEIIDGENFPNVSSQQKIQKWFKGMGQNDEDIKFEDERADKNNQIDQKQDSKQVQSIKSVQNQQISKNEPKPKASQLGSQQPKSQSLLQKQLSNNLDKRLRLLDKLFYQDKLLSPKTYELKLSKLRAQANKNVLGPFSNQIQQDDIDINKAQQAETTTVIDDTQKIEEQQGKNVIVCNKEDISPALGNYIQATQKTQKKMKLFQLTEKFKQSVQVELLRTDNKRDSKQAQWNGRDDAEEDNLRANVINADIVWKHGQDGHHNDFVISQPDSRKLSAQFEQCFHVDQASVNEPSEASPGQHRYGFPTQLLFIKNYLFKFFTFIKSSPQALVSIFCNLLKIPYDNEHLLTCYRTQLHEIDSYYANAIEGSYLAYPYWRNLIEYQPIIETAVFQSFSQFVEAQAQKQPNQDDEDEIQFMVSEIQDQKYRRHFINSDGNNGSLKQLQRIFLMMLMDCFNEAFEEQRCSFNLISLIKIEQKGGGMCNYQIVKKTLKKLSEIERIQSSTPSHYLHRQGNNIDLDVGSSSNTNLVSCSSPPTQLQQSEEPQLFILCKVRQQTQQLIDLLLCPILRRVLQTWGRTMCGIIIQPEDQDQMQITLQQIQVKNAERLCLALNSYVWDYEKELARTMKEHQLCTKLIIADKVLEFIVEEIVAEKFWFLGST